MTLKLIVQVAPALIYAIFFSSVVPTYLISQPILVTNTQRDKSLFTDERTRKITSVVNSIPSKCLKFASRHLERHWDTGLNVHIESSGVFSVCYKIFFGVLKVVANNIYFSNTIFHLTFIKVWVVIIQKNKHC